MTLFLLSALFLQEPDSSTVYVDRVAIKVNDKILTQRELVQVYRQRRAEYLHKYQGADLDSKLRELWTETVRDAEEQLLLFEKAVELGISYSEDEVRSQMVALKESNGLSQEEFEEAILGQTGMAFEEFLAQRQREQSAHAVIQSRVLSQIKIDDAEIAKYFEEHRDNFMTPATYRISEIVVLKEENAANSRARAEECLAALKSGRDFSDAAREYSDSTSRERDGDLGTVQYGDLNSTIEDAVGKLVVGQVSDILATEFAFFIIKLTERTPPKPKPINEVREEILTKMREPMFETQYLSFIEDLKGQYLLETYLKKPPAYLDL